MRVRFGIVLTAILAAPIAPAVCVAQASGNPPSLVRRGVDMVGVTDGPVILGSIVSRRRDGSVTIATRRKWFEESVPKLYLEYREREVAAAEKVHEELVSRLDNWIEARRGQQRLVVTLEDYQARLADGPELPDSEFVLVKLDGEHVRRVYQQPSARKRVAMTAWREQLDDVEKRSIKDLERELADRGMVVPKKPIDLSDRVGRVTTIDDREWAARVAVFEFLYAQKVSYAGTIGNVLRADGPQELGQAGLLKIVQGQMNSQIASLLNEGGAVRKSLDPDIRTATAGAEADGARGVQITWVDFDLTANRIEVSARFLAQMPDGKWETVWEASKPANASDTPADLASQLGDDPQIKQALDMARQFGAGDAVTKALRLGAATKVAQDEIKERFSDFLGMHRKRLDGPPLMADARPGKR